MYHEWPFFRAVLDNATLALAKTDLTIAGAYFRLVENPDLEEKFSSLIANEYDRCCEAVAATTGQSSLLIDVPWLQDSIRRRSPFVDALNLMQVDLLNRLRSAGDAETADTEEWAHMVRLTIQGIAAGMRTTG
jgi:phosphoenolpyruvate carboxylase